MLRLDHPVRRRLFAVVPLAALLALAGCGGSEEAGASDPLAKVTVTGGSDDKAPKVSVSPAPLSVSDTTTRVVTGGTGATLKDDSIVQVRFVMLNGKDGKQLTSTYGSQDFGFAMDSESVIPGLSRGLAEQKIGSRVLVAVPPADAFGTQGNPDLGVGTGDSIVFLIDVLREVDALPEATGAAVKSKSGLPTVTMGKDATTPASFTIPKSKPPTKTVAQPLITGKGAKVVEGQTIRISYTGVLYKDGSTFDSSATNGKGYLDSPIGVGGVIKGWDDSLVGQRVGTRMLLVIPPADGYGSAGRPPKIAGTDTLVFVVDILAAF